MPKVINAFTARTHLGQLIKQASEGERFILTKKGRPKVVILGVDDFEDLLEVAAEQEDKELQRALRDSMRQYKRGGVSSLEALRAIYARSR
jgi:prevent-host-death family protein